jgi:uncharacterized membrane protein (DUF373 family)
MNKDLLKKFEVAVFYILTGLVVLYIAVEMVELIYQFAKAIFTRDETSHSLFIAKEQREKFLPVFFNILIAIELIDTFNIYIKEHSIKVQNILLIGLIALGRKLLVLDVGYGDGIQNIGLAAIIIALAAGYYILKRSDMTLEK